MSPYVRISDPVEVQRFIRALRTAIKKAKANKGGYSAFLHDEDDEIILQLEIAPLVRPT